MTRSMCLAALWALCAIVVAIPTGCTFDGEEMAIYREQEKIWLNKNWVTPGSGGPPPATPPPVPPKRKKHPFFLAWLPFRIVFDSSSRQPHQPKEMDIDIHPDLEREYVGLKPTPLTRKRERERFEELDREQEEKQKKEKEAGIFEPMFDDFFSRWSIEWE